MKTKVLAVAAIAALAIAPDYALAQTIDVPWGEWAERWLNGIQDIAVLALTTAAAYVVSAYVPAWLRAIAGKSAQVRVNEVLEKAVLSAIAQTKGAVVGKRLSIPIANEVLRRAGQYAVDQAPALIDSVAGTAKDLIKMVLARMEAYGVVPGNASLTVKNSQAEKKPSETDFAAAITKGLGGT